MIMLALPVLVVRLLASSAKSAFPKLQRLDIGVFCGVLVAFGAVSLSRVPSGYGWAG